MKWHRIALVAAVALAGGLALAQETPSNPALKPAEETWELKDKCSLYLDFDGTLEANFAEGETKPQKVEITVDGQIKVVRPDDPALKKYFVPGLRGKALSTKDGKTGLEVIYPAARNFDSRQGTVAFWMKYDAVVNDPASYLCFRTRPGVIQFTMGREVKGGKVAEGAVVHFYPPSGVKADRNGRMVLPREQPWKLGEWHYMTLAWDLQEFRYYEDGALVGKQAWETGRPMAEGMASQFDVVLAGWSGKNHNTVVMAEFCIFSIPLTEKQVEQEYERLRPNPAAGAGKP